MGIVFSSLLYTCILGLRFTLLISALQDQTHYAFSHDFYYASIYLVTFIIPVLIETLYLVLMCYGLLKVCKWAYYMSVLFGIYSVFVFMSYVSLRNALFLVPSVIVVLNSKKFKSIHR
jgi:hypothetical protein